MFTVLFTSIGRRVELVRAFKKSYETMALKAQILGVDAEPSFAPASYFVDRCFKVPKVDDESYVDTLLGICRAEKVDLLIPLFEPEFSLLEAKRYEFERLGILLLLSKRQVLEICQDKLQTYCFFTSHKIKTPETWNKTNLPKDISFPIFVKPRKGMGSRGAQRVDTLKQLEFIIQQDVELLIQEFVPGKEYTLDILADLEGQVLSVVPRERLEVRAGEVSKSRTVYRRDLIEQGKYIVEKLGAIGPVTAQCIDNGKDVYWLEVNPRFGGGVPLAIQAGVDYPLLLYQMVRKQSIQPFLGQYNHDLTMLRYDQAVYF
ncbi:MAG: ATP-grasp domain-containing protein [Firmicutes bacterium]|jgi:carbamoyl-phosphate synthase large subunit|nr:ATP-grasp domain-containing protein [Bacillota bacterium]